RHSAFAAASRPPLPGSSRENPEDQRVGGGENVPRGLVLTKYEQRMSRKAPRGYKAVGSRRDAFMNV
ncbi:hypothetical protein B0H34DRAFT_193996, partial [Crassisporium funariophilum]